MRGAFLCFVVAWALPALASPLVRAALGPLPVGFAILAGALPVLTASFAATAARPRYCADRLRHALA